MEMMNTLIFNVLMAVTVSLAGVIMKTLLPYLKEKKEETTARIRKTRWAWAADIIDAVVRAVEQTVSEEVHGEEKKEIAVDYISKLLRQNGLDLSREQVDALVEAAVQTMNAERRESAAGGGVSIQADANEKEQDLKLATE